jgi:hypothetical protein
MFAIKRLSMPVAKQKFRGAFPRHGELPIVRTSHAVE